MSKLIKNSVVLGVKNPIHQLVLAKIDPEEFLDRSKVKTGEHKFSFDVHVEGKLKVSEDHWQVFWHKTKPLAMLSFALDKLNANSRHKVLEEAFDWYSKMSEKQREDVEAKIKKDFVKAEESVKEKTKTEKKKVEKHVEDIKDETKMTVEISKSWGYQKCNGKVSIKELKLEVKKKK